MSETSSTPSGPSLCALPGCGAAIVQPTGGGRRRLFCSNAHRAEAGRLRLAGAPRPAPADALDSGLDRLAAALDDLRRHRETLRSIDPAHLALETARVRAEATAEVLAAQQAAASAAQDASRAHEQLATERSGWEEQRGELEARLDEAGQAAAAARLRAAEVQDALDGAIDTHARELGERDAAAARFAAAHEKEMSGLLEELERVRTAAASAEARSQGAEQRAGVAEDGIRAATEENRRVEAEAARLRGELAGVSAALAAATIRADAAEAAMASTRAELAAERRRQDAAVGELRQQVGALIAATAATPRRVRSGSAAKTASASASTQDRPPGQKATGAKKR